MGWIFNYFRSIRGIIKLKNAQLRAERERLCAAEAANRIYAAYIAWAAKGCGSLRVPRREIGELIGKYRAEISLDGDCYIVGIKELGRTERDEPLLRRGGGSSGNNRNGSLRSLEEGLRTEQEGAVCGSRESAADIGREVVRDGNEQI